jgi:hypothetical protein
VSKSLATVVPCVGDGALPVVTVLACSDRIMHAC